MIGTLPVAILSGGLATRLRPMTETIPKSLVEVRGEPFAAHQLRLLQQAGVRKVVMCVGYLGEMVRDFTGDGSRFGLEIQYSFDGPTLRGTAGALKQAFPLLDDKFLVIYGDSYLPCDYAAAADAFLTSGKQGLMTVYRNEGQWDTSNVEFDGTNVVAYDKKNRTERMRYIDYGLGAFEKHAFTDVPQEGAFDLADVYKQLVQSGQLAAFEVKERFYEIGSFSGIKDLETYLT